MYKRQLEVTGKETMLLMRYQSFQFNRHHIMLSIVIISLLTISGCTSTVDDKSGGKSEPEKANGIELNIPIESQSGLLLHLSLIHI